MKVELDINTDELIEISEHYCAKLAEAELEFSPVKDTKLIEKLVKTGLLESGLIENGDGYWTIGRRDGEHVLIEYKPFD